MKRPSRDWDIAINVNLSKNEKEYIYGLENYCDELEKALEIACELAIGGNAGLKDVCKPPFYFVEDIVNKIIKEKGTCDSNDLKEYLLKEVSK